MEAPPIFKSAEDECSYWKEHAKLYHNQWSEIKQEYAEYIENSRQMEAEMDATLDQKESMIKDLKSRLQLLAAENESLKNNNESYSIEYFNLEKQFEALKIECNSMKEGLRELEQKNDNLERAERILQATIRDYEVLLEKAYEKNALLEMEIDEKEMLQGELQRLSDEKTIYKQQLIVKAQQIDRKPSTASLSNDTVSNGNIYNQEKLNSTTPIDVVNKTASTNNINSETDNSFKGLATTAALNEVSDMLRKLKMDPVYGPMPHPIQ